MQNPEHKQKLLITISIFALSASVYAGSLAYKSKISSYEIEALSESNDKLAFLLSLERPTPLTATVQDAIKKLDEHMYNIRNDKKEKGFARCMMQAVTEMTGSMGLYIDLATCGENINNKATLDIFKELESISVAPECRLESMENQAQINMCLDANEDHRAIKSASNILFKLTTSYSLWEMHLISKGNYARY